MVDVHTELIRYPEPEVRYRRLGLLQQMTMARAGQSADRNQRQRVGGVCVAVAHAGAVKDQRVIEQGAVAIGRALQLLDEFGELLRVIEVDLRVLGVLDRIVAVMRDACGAARSTSICG